MPDWDKIGRALGGFGAGVANRGPEYLANLQAMDNEQQDRLDERTVRDAYTVKGALDAGDINQARYHVIKRLDSLRERGIDSSDTFGLLQLIEQGDIETARREVDTVVNYASQMGKTSKGRTASQSDYDYFVSVLNDPNKSKQEKEAAEYSLGLRGKPQGERIYDAAGNMFVIDPVTGTVVPLHDPEGNPMTAEWTGQNKGRIAELTEEGAGKARTKATQRDERISIGFDAAKGIPTAKRGLELLKLVRTGGPQGLLLRVKQAFGVESADEGELANLMGKAVLSQLKATFGAQFTEREGALLANIEAGFGKSPEANRRVLQNVIKLAEMRAKRAMEDAAAIGDYETAKNIKEYLSFEYGGDDNFDDFFEMNRDVEIPAGFKEVK